PPGTSGEGPLANPIFFEAPVAGPAIRIAPGGGGSHVLGRDTMREHPAAAAAGGRGIVPLLPLRAGLRESPGQLGGLQSLAGAEEVERGEVVHLEVDRRVPRADLHIIEDGLPAAGFSLPDLLLRLKLGVVLVIEAVVAVRPLHREVHVPGAGLRTA